MTVTIFEFIEMKMQSKEKKLKKKKEKTNCGDNMVIQAKCACGHFGV